MPTKGDCRYFLTAGGAGCVKVGGLAVEMGHCGRGSGVAGRALLRLQWWW